MQKEQFQVDRLISEDEDHGRAHHCQAVPLDNMLSSHIWGGGECERESVCMCTHMSLSRIPTPL